MTPHHHKSTTAILGEPHEWDAETYGECAGLPITQVGGTMFSYWVPSFGERLAIMTGRPVRLGIFGNRHPPVSVDTL